jgi:hypothetical protein
MVGLGEPSLGRQTREEHIMTNTIDITDIKRGTEWVRKFSFHTGKHVVENLNNDGYVAEKREQAVADTKALIRFLDTFITTGDLAHLADYRGRLEVMAREVDAGAWHSIVESKVNLSQQ